MPLISLFAGLLEASTYVSPAPALHGIEIASAFETQSYSVIDGDTIRLDDGTSVRLNGFNAPESHKPQCDREAILGNRAKERLEELSTTAGHRCCRCHALASPTRKAQICATTAGLVASSRSTAGTPGKY